MSQSLRTLIRSPRIMFLLFVSFFGLLLANLFQLLPSANQQGLVPRKPAVGSIFSLICILGIIAAFFPQNCTKAFYGGRGHTSYRRRENLGSKEAEPRGGSFIFGLRIVHGHHPICEGLAHHEFRVGSKTFCTACMGLFFGALIALLGAALYFFVDLQIEETGLLLTSIGTIGVLLALMQFVLIDVRQRALRFALNIFFVVGAFLILVGVDAASKSLALDLFVLALCVFWILTRISLSRWSHRRICHTCELSCKIHS